MQGKVNMMVRTRIAPSPTGFPHIGTIYQALFDYAYAKRFQGKFFVRIEDTDRERLVENAEEKIYEALDWFGLTEDESTRKGGGYGPYRQSDRLPIYKKYALELIEKGGAYYCFCSKERIEELRKKQQELRHSFIMYDKHCRNLAEHTIEENLKKGMPFVIRLKVPEQRDIVAKDLIRGEIHFKSDLIEDTVLLKSDGYPTYHFASSVVDDHLMKTSHVVRGEEWLPSLPKHIILYDYFGWEKPIFVHTPVLRNPDKSKLSKRHGHTNVTWYREEGFLPSAILNYLALMAWSHPEEKEIFTLDEFIALVDFKDMKPAGPVFDIEKLKWMNGEYIRAMNDSEFLKLLENFYKGNKEIEDFLEKRTIDIKTIASLAKTRIKTLKEFKDLVLQNKIVYTEKDKQIAEELLKEFIQMESWESDKIFAGLKTILQKFNIRMNTIYLIMTGKDKGLPLPEFLQALSKKEALKRINLKTV